MARTPLVTSIDLSGPFFTRDPRKTFRKNVRELMALVADEAEQDVKAQLRAGEAGRQSMRGITPDRVSGHVVGRVRSLVGKPWQVTAVVSVNNSGFSRAQGIRLMASAASLERRFHPFRRTASRVRRAVETVDLTKGL